MIKFIPKVNDASLQDTLRGYPTRIVKMMERTMTRLSLEVQRHVKQNKLSGQVLHVRTGTLRRSINREVYVNPKSVGFIVGTNVRYAAAHEYGFRGPVTVRQHVRREKKRFATYNKKEDVWVVRSKNTGFSGMVRSHTRIMNIPERSFLRSALRDYEQRIKNAVQTTAAEAMSSR